MNTLIIRMHRRYFEVYDIQKLSIVYIMYILLNIEVILHDVHKGYVHVHII